MLIYFTILFPKRIHIIYNLFFFFFKFFPCKPLYWTKFHQFFLRIESSLKVWNLMKFYVQITGRFIYLTSYK